MPALFSLAEDNIYKMASVIPAITKLSSRVTRILGLNPSIMTLQGTNTYIIGTGKRRILVDTGDADVPQYISHLKTVLASENIDLSHILLTHWHHDHVDGLDDILENLGEFTVDCEVWKFPRAKDHEIHENILAFEDRQEIAVDGATLQVIHTPGHTTDHVAFYLKEENAIFSGDCILGEGTAVFEDLYDYIKSLNDLLEVGPKVIYPGHGNIIHDPMERIRFYIKHRLEREQQIVSALSKDKDRRYNEKDIVSEVYKELDARLQQAAEGNVNHHLQKLLKEGRVRKIGNVWQISQKTANL